MEKTQPLWKAHDSKLHTPLKLLDLETRFQRVVSSRSEKRLSAKGFLRLLPSKPLIKQFYSRNNNLLSEDKNLNRAFQIQLQHETTTNTRGLKGFLISILKQHDRLFWVCQ